MSHRAYQRSRRPGQTYAGWILSILLFVGFAGVASLSGEDKSDRQWGDEYLRAGDYKKAVEAYDKHISGPNPQVDLQFTLNYVEALRHSGQYKKALDYAAANAPAEPKTAEEWRAQCLLGELQFFTGNPAKAEAIFKNGADAGDLRCQLFLKRHYLRTGRRHLTGKIINQFYDYWTKNVNVVDDDEKADPDVLATIGAVIWDDNPEAPDDALNRCYARAQKIARARGIFNPEHYLWSGEMAITLFNFPLARDEFNAVLKVRKNDPDAGYGLALVLFEQSRYKDALEVIDKVLEVNPNHVGARALSVSCRLADENAATVPLDIEKELLALHQLSPTHLETMGLLYGHYLQESNEKRAREIEREMKKLNPNPSEFYCIAGDVLERSRNFIESGELFQKAIEVDEKYWRAHFAFAQNRRRLGDEYRAQKHFDITYKLNPYNVYAVNMKRSLRYLIGDENANPPVAPDYVTHETKHFILRVHTREDKVVAPYYLAILEEVHDRLTKRWGFEPKGFAQEKILIEIFPTFEDFAAATIGLPQLGALGACFGPTVTLVSPRAAMQGEHPFFNWQAVFEHEFTHCITLQMSGYKVPRWFTEGCSTHQEEDEFLHWDQLLVDGLHQKQLLPIEKINAGFTQQTFPGRIQLSYYHGKLIVDHIVRVYGLDAVKKILLAYKAGKDDIEAVREGTGAKLEDIDQGVLEDARKLVAGIKRRPQPEPSDLVKLQAAVAKDPNDLKAKEELTLILGQTGQMPAAKNLADELYRHDPKNAVANKILGIHAFLNKNGELARAYLQAAVAADPEDFRSWLYLGNIYKDAAQTAKALAAWKKALEIYPRFTGDAQDQSDNLYNRLADLQVDADDPASAIETLAASIKLDRGNYQGAAKLAKLRLEAKQYQGAIDAALESIFIHPYQPEVHLTAAAAYTALKDFPRAEREYSVATALDNKMIDAWLGLAKARIAAENYTGAMVAVGAALELDGNNAEAAELNAQVKKALKSVEENELGDR